MKTVISRLETAVNDSYVPECDNESTRYCLNCGKEVIGNFCSHCGQPTGVPAKLNNKTFGKSVVMSFARLNPGFFNTFLKLCYKPWDVIRDYIHGKQVPYSHPVSMLIQLTLYTSFIIMIMEGLFDIKWGLNKEIPEGTHWMIRIIKESTVLRVLWISVPVTLAAYLAYWKHGSRRFTFSEYLIANLYVIIAVRIYFFFLTPVNYIFFEGDIYSGFIIGSLALICLFIGSVIIYKAFPIKSKWKAIGVFLWFIVLAAIFFSIYKMGFDILEDLLQGHEIQIFDD